jgi:hypothetical protein
MRAELAPNDSVLQRWRDEVCGPPPALETVMAAPVFPTESAARTFDP